MLQFDVQEQNEVAEDRLELFPSPVCVYSFPQHGVHWAALQTHRVRCEHHPHTLLGLVCLSHFPETHDDEV